MKKSLSIVLSIVLPVAALLTVAFDLVLRWSDSLQDPYSIEEIESSLLSADMTQLEARVLVNTAVSSRLDEDLVRRQGLGYSYSTVGRIYDELYKSRYGKKHDLDVALGFLELSTTFENDGINNAEDWILISEGYVAKGLLTEARKAALKAKSLTRDPEVDRKASAILNRLQKRDR